MKCGDVSCLGVLEEDDQTKKVKFVNREFQQYAASKYITQSIERAREIEVNYLRTHFSNAISLTAKALLRGRKSHTTCASQPSGEYPCLG